jgi:hypothetical protein
MHLLYADDSGSVGDASQAYFVLGGVCVFERQPHWIGQELDNIAAAFNPAEPQSVELHGNPMLKGAKLWRKFPLEQRVNAISAGLKVFAASHRDNRAFCVVVHKATVIERLGRDPIEVAFEQLASRFDQYLGRLHKRGDTQRGMIIFDKSKNETELQKLATDFKMTGHSFGQLRNLAEVPVFIDSRASRLVQLADLIAYATFRKFEAGDTQFFDIFAHRFDEYGGQKHGLYVYPTPDAL